MKKVLPRRSFLQAAGLAAAGSLVTGPRASRPPGRGDCQPAPPASDRLLCVLLQKIFAVRQDDDGGLLSQGRGT